MQDRTWRYALGRIAAGIPVLAAVSAIIFVLMAAAPGDPAQLLLGQEATPERVAAVREELGLDEPIYMRYGEFVWGVLRGDFGRSFQTDRPVGEQLFSAAGISLTLAAVAMLIAVIVGMAVGIASAIWQFSFVDTAVRVLVLAAVSMPVFWLGLLLIALFSVELGWLPAFGWGTPKQMILPAIALSTFPLAVIARLTRSSMLEVLRQDYIRAARSHGLSERRVILAHAVRNALIPILTIAGLQFGVLIAGSVMTESVFAIPGLGRLTVNAILSRDYPTIQAALLLGSAAFVVLNILVDIAYRYVNPRIRAT